LELKRLSAERRVRNKPPTVIEPVGIETYSLFHLKNGDYKTVIEPVGIETLFLQPLDELRVLTVIEPVGIETLLRQARSFN